MSRAPQGQRAGATAGFTLVELVLVIALMATIAIAASVTMGPLVRAQDAQAVRSVMVSDLGTAVRTLGQELRAAVPNSLRSPTNQCVELVPTYGGGRMRLEPDLSRSDSRWYNTVGFAGGAGVPTDGTVTSLDVLNALERAPQAGDWVVINNRSPADVYSGVSRAQMTAPSSIDAALGTTRLNFAALAVAPAYTGARFGLVAASTPAVTYYCLGVTGALDAQGNASGTLMRRTGYGFVATAPTACPAAGASGASVVLENVSSCEITYAQNDPATQQSGYVGVRLALTRRSETITLSGGAHVENVP